MAGCHSCVPEAGCPGCSARSGSPGSGAAGGGTDRWRGRNGRSRARRSRAGAARRTGPELRRAHAWRDAPPRAASRHRALRRRSSATGRRADARAARRPFAVCPCVDSERARKRPAVTRGRRRHGECAVCAGPCGPADDADASEPAAGVPVPAGHSTGRSSAIANRLSSASARCSLSCSIFTPVALMQCVFILTPGRTRNPLHGTVAVGAPGASPAGAWLDTYRSRARRPEHRQRLRARSLPIGCLGVRRRPQSSGAPIDDRDCRVPLAGPPCPVCSEEVCLYW